jgi:hypothetical protein
MTSTQHLAKIRNNSESIMFAKEALELYDNSKINSASGRATITAISTLYEFLENLEE